LEPWTMAAAYSVSEGVLAYRAPDQRVSQLTWFDRDGRVTGTLGEPDQYSYFRLAPDGMRVATDIGDARRASRSIWFLDPATGSRSRFTFAGSHDWIPVWSPDGARLLFSSFRDGPSNLYQKSASGAAADEPVYVSSEQKFAHDWSPDGRFIAYMESHPTRDLDIHVRRVHGADPPIVIAQTDAAEFYPRFSPNGRWIAYGSTESGISEVYVQAFPPTGGKWQISSGGGTQIRWSANGRELFYLTSDLRRLVARNVTTTPSFAVGPARTLFQLEHAQSSAVSNVFEVTRDGQRFLFNMLRPAAADAGTTVVLNWATGLRR
jgi:Tol biopolymer transport system component